MSTADDSSATDESRGTWKVYVSIGALVALFIFVYVYGHFYNETQRQIGARTAKGVVIEKNFAPAQSVAGISSGGSFGVGSTEDRYIVAVRATEGATGLKEIDVDKGVYYRLNVGAEVRLIITRGDISDEGKYRVEIDTTSIPAPGPIQTGTPRPALPEVDRESVTNAKGEIRR